MFWTLYILGPIFPLWAAHTIFPLWAAQGRVFCISRELCITKVGISVGLTSLAIRWPFVASFVASSVGPYRALGP